MCDLLGLSFNQPVRCSLSLSGFRHRGEANPHGWGIARFEGKACQLFKEPVKVNNSKLAAFVRDYESFVSHIFIGHVRDASRGDHTLQNTHPFVRTFRGRDFVFAHNGTMEQDVIEDTRFRFHPVGETDSERLLCALLTELSIREIAFDDFLKLETLLNAFNEHGKMNLLFSEGEHLYCYRDVNGHNGLCMIERVAPYDLERIEDNDWKVYLPEEKDPDQRGFVIASHPLTDENTTDLEYNKLYVFRDGQRVYGL